MFHSLPKRYIAECVIYPVIIYKRFYLEGIADLLTSRNINRYISVSSNDCYLNKFVVRHGVVFSVFSKPHFDRTFISFSVDFILHISLTLSMVPEMRIDGRPLRLFSFYTLCLTRYLRADEATGTALDHTFFEHPLVKLNC
jgi:hypothetical protein